MVLDLLFEFLGEMSQINTTMLVVAFLIFIVIAYKIFSTLLKALMVGIVAGAFPVVVNFLGFDVPVNLGSVMWFATFGIMLFLVYSSVLGGLKILSFLFKPFRAIRRKKKERVVVVKEKSRK